MADTCKTCNWWLCHRHPKEVPDKNGFSINCFLASGEDKPVWHGECRKSAPIIHPNGWSNIGLAQGSWPATHEKEWCGEYEEKTA